MEELPLFREACRSSRRTRSSSATLDSRNRSTRAISSSRDSSSNPDTAQDHHISQPTHHTRHAEDQTTDLNAYPKIAGGAAVMRPPLRCNGNARDHLTTWWYCTTHCSRLPSTTL